MLHHDGDPYAFVRAWSAYCHSTAAVTGEVVNGDRVTGLAP